MPCKCSTTLKQFQKKVAVYDASSTISRNSLCNILSCCCTVNSPECTHPVNTVLFPHNNPLRVVWGSHKKASFVNTFTQQSAQGSVAILDQNTLYCPIPEGSDEFLSAGFLSTGTRERCVNAISRALNAVLTHPHSTMTCMVMDPCSASIATLRFKEVTILVDYARRLAGAQASTGAIIPLEAHVEPSSSVGSSVQLLSCKEHPLTARVCPKCLYTADPLQVHCQACWKEWTPMSSQPPAHPSFDELKSFDETKPSASYASRLKKPIFPENGSLPAQSLQSSKQQQQLFAKMAALESIVDQNYKQTLDNQIEVNHRLTGLESTANQYNLARTPKKVESCPLFKRIQKLENNVVALSLEQEKQQCTASPGSPVQQSDAFTNTNIQTPALDPFVDEGHAVE